MHRVAVRTSLLGLFAFVFAISVAAQAGQIDPGLESQMQTANADEFISVVIRPIGALSGIALKRQVTTQYATRTEQHRATVEALQATSAAAQPTILSALGSAAYQGRVADVKGFWIDNVITAVMTPSAIRELSARADVMDIVAMPRIELVTPIAADASGVNDQLTVQNGLKAIRADSVWALGYTGSGRLLASIDTGVEGRHSLLSPKWRGHNGASVRESWFDPVYSDTLPRVFAGNGISHGTQVMGLMVATSLTDTMGVCPDCQWISAAAIDIPCPTNPNAPCGNLFEALQWVADPDGDPLTDADVPDAVANPWGAVSVFEDEIGDCFLFNGACGDLFWNVIDNIEAAGAVMIFASGNEGDCGTGRSTIRNPANRITSETNAFSVGMVDTRTSIENPPVDTLSSFGPSSCDNVTIKPELVAPGVNLRTTIPGGGVSSTAYGTSFSTPHVAAAVALLREYNPNATVEQIKQALLSSAKDLGLAGPDNQYGHGLLNVIDALRALPVNTQPSLVVKKTHYARPAPGQASQVVLVLRNSGAPANSVNVTLTSNDPRLTIQDGTATFPNMPNVGDTAANHDDPFDVTVSGEDIVSGERLAVTVTMTSAGGYTRTMPAALQTGPAQSLELFTHNVGNVLLTVSSFGGFGLQNDNLNPRKGATGYGQGFFHGIDAIPSLFEGAFVVGVGPTQVSDGARNLSGSPDVDFLVDPGGLITATEPGTVFPEETRAAFTDANAESPIGVTVEQRTWATNDPAEDDHVIAEYTIWNRTGQTLNGLHAGLYFDWDFPWTGPVASQDSGGHDESAELGWMQDATIPRFRGLAVISPLGMTAYRYFDNLNDVYDGLTEAEKWDAMTDGFVEHFTDSTGDGSHLVGTGPYTILPDSSATVAFAIIGATTKADLIASAQTAIASYNAGVLSITPGSLSFSAAVGAGNPDSKTITINNASDESITFTVESVPDFADVNPMSGAVPAGTDMDLAVSVDVGDFDIGTYRDTVRITTSDPTLTLVKIPVTLTVTQFSVSPNPFNPTAASANVTLTLNQAATSGSSARVFDLAGELVRDLGELSVGTSSFQWDGRTDHDHIVANGVYLCHVDAPGDGGFKQTFKIAVKKN